MLFFCWTWQKVSPKPFARTFSITHIRCTLATDRHERFPVTVRLKSNFQKVAFLMLKSLGGKRRLLRNVMTQVFLWKGASERVDLSQQRKRHKYVLVFYSGALP